MDPAVAITRALRVRVGPGPQIRVEPDAHNPGHYLVCIGDGGPTSFVIAWREGEPFTDEIARAWAEEYRLLQLYGGPHTVTFNPTIPIPRDVYLEVNRVHDEINRVTLGALAANPDWADAVMGQPIRRTGGTMATATNAPAVPVTPRGVRTPEQEVRFQTLQAESTRRVFLNLELAEWQRLQGMAPCPTPLPPVTPPRPRIRVKVWRDDYQQWQVMMTVGNNGRELPSISVIKSLLPPADKHFLPSRQGRHTRTLNLLRVALDGGLSAQSLHDALRAWVVATEGMPTSAESDSPILDESTAMLLNAQPATLEVGGKVYKLVPTKELDARPLIKRVRERALSLAMVEGEGIRTRARTDARVVVSEAENRAATLREEVERERRAMGNRAPEWVANSGRSHRWQDGYWYVEMRVLCKVVEIRYTVSSWNRVLHWTPLNVDNRPNSYYEQWRMPVWVRLREEGHYTKDDISCRGGGYCSTHIDSYMCMELQGLPPVLTSANHLLSLEQIIGRGMQVVNLNSPLNTNPRKYWPPFLEQLPPVPLKLMTCGERADRYIIPNGRTIERWQAEHPDITWDRSELIEQEAATIFHVQEGTNATTR